MRGSRLFLSVLSAACLTITALPGESYSQTLQSCFEQQLRYAGTTCRGYAKCYAKALKKGHGVDQNCLDERDAEIQQRFELIESQGPCLTEPAGPTVKGMLETSIDSQASALNSLDRCSGGKIGGIGRACKQIISCYARAVAGSEPAVDPFCIDKASNKMEEVFERLETKYVCSTNNDAAARAADTETVTEDIYEYLRGTGTTTTSTTVFTSSTTTLPGGCAEDGSFTACEAYRDDPACKACVDSDPDQIAKDQCTGAGPLCADSFNNQGCAFAINTATACAATCCP